MASEIKVDTVSEKTSGSGVTIDGLLIKDGGISGDVSLIGTTPTFTIGDAGAEDAALVFDGNAQDFYIALDDSADDLLIGLGSTVGTTAAVSIDENLQVKIVATTASTSATTGSFIAAGGAGIAADLHVGDDVTLISDSAVLGFGADKDTTLTHTDGTGLTLNSTNKLTFGDAASFIQQSSDGVLRIDGEATVDINASTAVTISNDLKLDSDSAVLAFGADSEITVTHSADSGLLLKHTATADDKPINLILQTGETDMAANDVIGKISFQAPDEGTGTDAILVSAAIQARAEGDHSSSSNATSIDFMTGASEAAATKLTLTSAGHLLPATDDAQDLGSSAKQFRDIYTGDLNLNNTRHRKNEVDGTSGSWTIQEGKDNLYLLNRLNNKKYKFNLTEVK